MKKHLKKLMIGLTIIAAFVVATPLTSQARDYYYRGDYHSYRGDRHHHRHWRHHHRHHRNRDNFRVYLNSGFYPGYYYAPAPVYYYPPSGASLNFGFVFR